MRGLQIALFVMGAAASATAQTLPAAAARPSAPAQAPATAPAPDPASPADTYSYRPDGRRDPFVSLVGAGTDPMAVANRGNGAAAFVVAEISVRGIMQSHDALIAMVQGPDNKTYLVHQGDTLADGVVKSVTSQGLVVLQDISDPLSNQRQREVRKLLRSLEDAK